MVKQPSESVEQVTAEQRAAADAAANEWLVDKNMAETAPLKVDLNSGEWNEAFKSAESFVKTSPMMVEEITAEGLEAGLYADKDVSLNIETGQYEIHTFVMATDENGNRVPKLENVRVVEPGMSIITNPLWEIGDRPNNFANDAAGIEKNYEPATLSDTGDGYTMATARGVMVRPKGYSSGQIQPRPVIQNPTGRTLEIEKWGGIQVCQPDGFVVDSGAPEKPSRYFLSSEDFRAYISADDYLKETQS